MTMLTDQRMPSGPMTEEECIDLYFNLLLAANARRNASLISAQQEFDRESKGARNDYLARIQGLRKAAADAKPYNLSPEAMAPLPPLSSKTPIPSDGKEFARQLATGMMRARKPSVHDAEKAPTDRT